MAGDKPHLSADARSAALSDVIAERLNDARATTPPAAPAVP